MNKNLDLFLTFMKIGAFTFGGGYAMIPLIQREVCDNKQWLNEDDILEVVAIAESTPGPVAINAAIPISIVLGVLLGAVVGIGLYLLFEWSYQHKHKIRNSTKVIILLGTAFLLMSIETLVKPHVALSGLLAVVAMACVVKRKTEGSVSARLSEKFGKLWITAEVMLFVLVGAAVDVRYTLSAGGMAVLMIFVALIFRAVGVCLCLLGTELTARERIFCVIAYLPKATVQAAIGSVPLSLGLPCGKIVLSVAVLAILITAPLGAIGIDRSYMRLLDAQK